MTKQTEPRTHFAGLKQARRNSTVLALALSMLIGASAQPALAADRVVQLLGVCGLADAQFEGNRRHVRTRLISFQPNGYAGIVIDGVEDQRVDALKNLSLLFEPPAAGTSTFVLRIKTKGGKVQEFAIGEPNTLPNIPAEPVPGSPTDRQISVQASDLLGANSTLKPDDIVAKYSLLFSCNKKNSRAEQYVENVVYGTRPVSLLLDPITCNLK